MSSEKTAERHADAIIAELYPGCPLQKSTQGVIWVPGKDGKPRAVGHREDVFGVFDRFVLSLTGWHGIQITDRTNAAARRKKVEAKFLKLWGPWVPPEISLVDVWAWYPREKMRVYRWNWENAEWFDFELHSPLLKKETRS